MVRESQMVLPGLRRPPGGGVQQAGRCTALEPKGRQKFVFLPTQHHGNAGCEENQTKGRKLGCTSLRDGEGKVSSERWPGMRCAGGSRGGFRGKGSSVRMNTVGRI